MKHMKVYATPDELHTLKNAARTPYITVGGVEPPSVRAMCHTMALKHGLPDIPGFYGLDLETGEFLALARDLVGESENADHPSDMSKPCRYSCQNTCENSYQVERIAEITDCTNVRTPTTEKVDENDED